MFTVLCLGFGVYQDIININHAELVKELSQGVIYEPLGYGWGVGEAKRHDKKLKQPITAVEGCFPFITFLDVDLVEISVEVDFGIIILGTADLVKGLFYARQRMPVFHGDVIESAVIDTDAGCRASFADND